MLLYIFRSKYLVVLVSKMHKYYSFHQPANRFSSMALFDDITQLSSSFNCGLNPQSPVTTAGTQQRRSTPQVITACIHYSLLAYYGSVGCWPSMLW